MSEEPVRLAPRFEALLGSMPAAERDDWEALATHIDERVRETEAKSTAPLWLMAPLPDEAHEPGAIAERAASDGAELKASESAPIAAPLSSRPSAPTPNPGGSASLAALARSVAQKGSRPDAARIAKESLSLAAAARAQSDAAVERLRSVRPTPPPRRAEVRTDVSPPPSSRAPVPPSSRAPARAVAAAAALPGRRSELGPWIAVGGLGVALAAALLVIARGREPATQIVVAQAPSAAPAVAAPPPAVAELAAAPSPVAAASEPAAVAAQAAPALAPLAASALPLSPKPAASLAAARASSEPAAVAARATSGARPAPEAIQLEETVAKPKVAADAPAASPSGMRPASGTTSGGLPDRPSTGAVQAAVGSVMGPARACVAGGVASPAQITFGSDGSVSSVTVSGPAAGTPAASCIEAALKRARVAPFTNQSFSLGVWVRP